MKIIVYLFLTMILVFTTACSDNDTERVFVDLPENAFTFTPTMGGAVLHYRLPDNPDIVAINVRYKDAYGKDILRAGSNLSDSVVLVGFNEAQKNIPAQVSFLLYNDKESQPIDVKFDTNDSAPISFINNASVKSGWNGFSLTIDNPAGTTGMGHVFYLGTNPQNNEPDTVLISSFPLTEGSDTITYVLQQERGANTIIVRAEDYRGYIVKERAWKGINAYNTTRLDPENFEIFYSNSVEKPVEKIGLQYLTDGDTKGTSWFQEENLYKYYTFLSDLNGAGEDSEPMYIDLKKPRLTSEVRFYAYLEIGYDKGTYLPDWEDYRGQTTVGGYWKGVYFNKLPSSVTIYGCKEDNGNHDWDAKKWEKIGSFEQNPALDVSLRWTYHCNSSPGNGSAYRYRTLAKMEAATPIYKAVNFVAEDQGEGYRYLKIKFNEVFQLDYEYPFASNIRQKYLTFHELEVYTNKE